MKKTASCIRMLMLLKARGFLSREELARELDTKIRNISVYKKELEDAGYTIESITGKYGGYQLKNGTLFPVLGLRREELKAIREAHHYIKSHPDFLMQEEFERAIDKIMATTTLREQESGVYMEESAPVSKEIKAQIAMFECARNEHRVIEMQYKSLNAKYFSSVTLHPYEILHDKGAYYCIAYSLKAKDYRCYKFSEERMRHVVLTNRYFNYDSTFCLKDHIGKSGLMKEEAYELEMIIHHEQALLVSEKPIGLVLEKRWIDEESLYMKTLIEGKLHTMQFILSLGNQCELIAPEELKGELVKICEDMQRRYNSQT